MIDNPLFKHFKAIGDIRTVISGATDLSGALRQCARIIREVSNAESAVIWYYDKAGDQRLHPTYAQGTRILLDEFVRPGEGVVGQAFSESRSVFLPDGTGSDGIRSMICVPLENSFETLGCFQFINRRDGLPFT